MTDNIVDSSEEGNFARALILEQARTNVADLSLAAKVADLVTRGRLTPLRSPE
jgi:hypothetical protein